MRTGTFFIVAMILLNFSCNTAPPKTFDFSEARKKLGPLQEKTGEPQMGDWLNYHDEPYISFHEYMLSKPVQPTAEKKTIYVQPIGDFDESEKKLVQLTAKYLETFYGLKTKILASVSDQIVPDDYRRKVCYSNYKAVNGLLVGKDTIAEQLQTTYILNNLLKPTLPADAVVMIALCDKDLFPDETFNYVFGQAQLKNRVGVWSFFRFGHAASVEEFPLVLKRTLKTASHETGHMFSLKHCAKYKCIMNGSNHLEEADRKPTGLCVDCLEKFCWNLGMSPQDYYKRMSVFWKEMNDAGEAAKCDAYLHALNAK